MKLVSLSTILLTLFCFQAKPGHALDLLPDQWQVQTMGYQGAVAAGVAYDSFYEYSWSLMIGYSPAELTEQDITQINWQHRLHPVAYRIDALPSLRIQPYLGISLLYGLGKSLYVKLPDQYPDSYYPPTALRATLEAGLRVDPFHGHSILLQWGMLDSEIGPLVNHSDQFTDDEHFGSWMIAWQASFK